jgi:hypothetical protein
MADKNDSAYSRTLLGAVGTDGVHRDLQGNEIPQVLTKTPKLNCEHSSRDRRCVTCLQSATS